MIQETARKIVKMQTKRPLAFVIVFAIIGLLMIPGILQLVNNVEPSLEKVLPSEIKEVKTMNNMRSTFGADMLYLIVYAEPPLADARNPALLNYISQLSDKISTREHIIDVNSIAEIVEQSNNDVIPESLQEVKEILRKNQLSEQFLAKDYSFTVIRIRSDTGASAELITSLIEDINTDIESTELSNPGSRISITGFNAIDKATFEVIISDFAFITVISMILVLIVVLLTFKSFAKSLLPMVVVMNALLWTMGLTGYLNLRLTVVSMVSAAMILGLGMDFGIHVTHKYFESRKKQSAKKSLTETMDELLRAMVGASLTTIAGFLALLFGVLPAMKTLGIILALGILNTLIGAVFLLPVIIYIYDGGIK